jgi:superfamily II helicase
MTSKATEKDRQVEQDLLSEIISLNPRHLMLEELVVKMKGGSSDTDRIAILDPLDELRSYGLIRLNGDVVEPTYAALCAAEIFQIP